MIVELESTKATSKLRKISVVLPDRFLQVQLIEYCEVMLTSKIMYGKGKNIGNVNFLLIYMEWIVLFTTCIQAIEMIVGKTDSVRFDKLCPLNTLLTLLT